MTTFSPIMILWYVFPVIVLFASVFLVSALSLNKKYQLKGPDVATPFLWFGMHQLSQNAFSLSILPYLAISILVLGILLVVFQAYYYGEITYKRFFKMFCRLTFLFSMLTYGLLIVMDIVLYL